MKNIKREKDLDQLTRGSVRPDPDIRIEKGMVGNRPFTIHIMEQRR